MTVWQVDQTHRVAGPIHQCADRRTTVLSDDQIALPIADAGARLDDRWPTMDQHRRSDEARGAFGGLAAALAQRPAGAQLGRQHPAQPTPTAQIQSLIDRFMTDVPLRAIRILRAQPCTDLLRTPGVFELVGHQLPQLRIDHKRPSTFSSSVISGTGVGEISVVHTLVVRLEMPAQLPRDRRRCPPDSAGDLADTVPVLAQGRDALALQQRQIARRARHLSHPRRWQTTRLGAPPIPGLAADPDLPAGLDGGHPTQDQLPVLVLQHQAPLAASSRHLHTPSFSRSVATSLRTRPTYEGQNFVSGMARRY